MPTLKCQRCRGPIGVFRRTGLFGGVHADLCPGCRSEWNDHLFNDVLWMRVLAADAKEAHYRSLAAAGTPVMEQDWLLLQLDRHEARKLAFELGKAFVKPPARDQASASDPQPPSFADRLSEPLA